MSESGGREQLRARMVAAARDLMNSRTDVVEACRRILSASSALGLRSEPCVVTIVAIESELDAFPAETARAEWSPDVLRRLDAEKAAYLATVMPELRHACETLIKDYGS